MRTYSATRDAQQRLIRTEEYNPSAPAYSHFTQIVWKATQTIGCGWASCPPGFMWGGGNNEPFLVCSYWPAGNYAGLFQENVGPRL